MTKKIARVTGTGLIVLATTFELLIVSSFLVPAVYAENSELSPRAQFLSGMDPHDIVCKTDHQLVFKATNWFPACVKPSSVDLLIERGWASNHLPHHMELMKTGGGEM